MDNNTPDISAKLFGVDMFGEPVKPTPKTITAKRFGVPPFSVLSTREGDWQNRKRAWEALGIKSEVGRDAKVFHIGIQATKENNWQLEDDQGSGTSIFDPVLCELLYRWYCPTAGQILDPFAGGSVRGIVAASLGLKYWGCDLSAKQIEANRQQAREIVPTFLPMWVVGDSAEQIANAPLSDLVFSCPPYGDLEKYSDDPRDLSNMEYPTFLANYKHIIQQCYYRMNTNSFAIFVVGDFRDKGGNYRGFVIDTIRCFKESAFEFYNEAILVNCIASASMRVTNQFNASRKLCKVHQNILVFCKGEWRKAVSKLPTFEWA